MLWMFPLLLLLQATAGRQAAHTETSPTPKIAFRLGHRDGVSSQVFSPDGKRFATGGEDGIIKLWDAQTGELQQTLRLPSESISTFAFSPDGATLASASSIGIENGGPENHVRLWDVATGSLKARLGDTEKRGYRAAILQLAYMPDGDLVICTRAWEKYETASVDLWDPRAGVLRRHITDPADAVSQAVFSPDGRTVAIGFALPGDGPTTKSHSGIKLWDLATGALKQPLLEAEAPLRQIQFSPDGRMLAGVAGEDVAPSSLLLWDLNTGTCLQTLIRNRSWIGRIAFAPDGKTLATAHLEIRKRATEADGSDEDAPDGTRGELVIWDIATGKPLQTQPLPGWISSIAYSPNGSRLATVCSEGGRVSHTPAHIVVSLWDPTTGARLKTASALHFLGLDKIVYAPDGKTLLTSGSVEGAVRLLDAETLQIRSYVPGDRDALLPLAFSPDGSLLLTGSNGRETALLWDLHTVRLTRRLEASPYVGQTTAVAFAPDGKTVATLRPDLSYFGIPAQLRLWSVKSAQPPIDLKRGPLPSGSTAAGVKTAHAAARAPRVSWNALAFSPDSHTLISGGQSTYGHNFNFTEEGKEGLAWWKTEQGTLHFVPKADTGEVFALAIAPDGKLLVTSGLYETIFWNAATGVQIRKMRTLFAGGAPAEPYREGRNRALAFSPNGHTLASGDTNVVRLLDAATGAELGRLEGHTRPIHAVSYSPDGKLLASASEDGTVRLWDLTTRRVRTVLSHDRLVMAVAFSPDGRLLVSGAADSALRFWNVKTGKLLLTLRTFPSADERSPSAWIAYTPEGYYDGSSDIQDYLRWQVGDRLLPASAFEKRYHIRYRVVAALKSL